MKRLRKNAISSVFALILVATTFGPRSFAEEYPSRLVKIIIPYTPGSPNDVIGRLIAPTLASRLGQPVIVENRAGTGGTLGTRAVANAEADGYTLLLTDCINHVLAPAFYSNLSYDPMKSFVPISGIARTSWVMITDSSTPASSLAEFIAYAKANPNKLNFGFGLATAPQIVGEFFKQATKTDILSVPYKGGAQAVTDMLAGRINLNFGTIATLKSFIENRKLKALAVTSDQRSSDLPDVPTMRESGLPELTLSFTVGLFAPAQTPEAVVSRLNGEINRVMEHPEIKNALLKFGFQNGAGTRDDFVTSLLADSDKWGPVAKGLGIKIE